MIKLPSVLAFERSIQPSIGLLWNVGKEQKTPVIVSQEKIRGTLSDYSSGNNIEKNIGNPNIQIVEVARLEYNCDKLLVEFNCLFTANSLVPVLCNNDEFLNKIEIFTTAFKKNNGYFILAEKYFKNIINGRWLWRNSRIGKIEIKLLNDEDHLSIIQNIAKALSGEALIYKLDVRGYVTVGEEQEVYPSQEFEEKTNSVNKNDAVKRVLAKLGNNHAYMHSQKIGNAIRTIDEWYSENGSNRPIAVEPFGVNQSTQKALRKPENKNDFYTYLLNMDKYIEELNNAIVSNESLFMVACLIRGGVFNGKSDKKPDDKSNKK